MHSEASGWKQLNSGGREMGRGARGLVVVALLAMGCLCWAPGARAASAPRSGEARGEPTDLGKAVEKEFGVYGRETPEGERHNDRLQSVAERITSAAGYRLKSVRLLGGADPRRDRVVNAFALPDGRVYVTLGLARAVEKAADPDAELAFVVGHELTHVTRKHGEDRQNSALGAGIAAILLGGITRSRSATTLANVGAAATLSHFSREDEYEADRGGLRAMNKAGYSLDAAASMLKRLQEVGGAQPNPTLNGWFGSHPLTGNRIARVQRLAARLRARAGKSAAP